MKNIKSLLAAGTLVAGLGVSAFSLPTYAAGPKTINSKSDLTCVVNGPTDEHCTLDGDYILGGDIDDLDQAVLDVNGTATLELAGHTITGNHTPIINVLEGKTLTISGDGTINGSVYAYGTLTINGGTYGNSTSNSTTLNVNEGATVVINGGTFLSGGASPIFVMNYDGTKTARLTITGGTFTAGSHPALLAEVGSTSTTIEISGGTFNGSNVGMEIMGSPTIKLSGGTFKCGDTGAGAIEIVSPTGDATTEVFNNILVSGYEYSDATAAVGLNEYYMQAAKLTAKSVTVRAKGSGTTPTTPTENNTTTPSSDKQKAMEEMGKEMEKLIAKGTSTGSTKKSTAKTTKVKAPNTGATDGAKAASGLTVLTMATLAGGALLLKKRG